MSARNKGKNARGWSLDKVYSFFPILKERAKYGGNSLSGGEQQMLAIGRALMTNPDLLLMDEPSEGLAPLIIQTVSHIISQLKDSGFSILLVEQNLDMALALANYIYIMGKSKIVYESAPEDLRINDEVRAKHLGATAWASEI